MRGPNGEVRRGDFMQRARQVILIATGEEEETPRKPGRYLRLTPERRSEIARNAALKRWHPDA